MLPTTPSLPLRRRGARLLPWLAASAGLLAGTQALAQEDLSKAPSVYLQGEWAEYSTDALTVGATLPWRNWSMPLWGGELRGHWDIYLSRWSFDRAPGGRSNSLVLGVAPTLRLRPDQGRAAWFWEAGLGANVGNHVYRTVDREFSTSFNFATHVGIGVNLGARRQHELLLSVQHVSNAGIKQPNPGLNFVQLRYALHF